MKADAWMPLYIADYLRDTMRLSTVQHGAYFLLLMACWAEGGTLSDDDEELAAITKMGVADWRKARRVMQRFFVVENGSWSHKRVTTELEKAKRLSDIRREQGAKGGRPKKQTESNEKPIGFANGNQSGLQTETPALVARPPPIPVPTEPPPIPPAGGQLALVPESPEVDEVEVAFDEWNALARRCGLPIAKALDKARRRSIAARLDEAGLDGWREALAGVEASAFCRGQRTGSDGRTMRADLGFVCQAKSFPRLREGFYGCDAKRPVAAPAEPEQKDAAIRRRVDRFKSGSGFWNSTDWGPPPGRPGCQVPPAILAEFGLAPSDADLFTAPAPGKDAA